MIYKVTENMGIQVLSDSIVRLIEFQGDIATKTYDSEIKILDARFVHSLYHDGFKFYIASNESGYNYNIPKMSDVFIRFKYYDIEDPNIEYLMHEIYFISNKVLRIDLNKQIVEDITNKILTVIDKAKKYGIVNENRFDFMQFIPGGLVPVTKSEHYDSRFEDELIELFPNPYMVELYEQLEQFEKENRLKFLEMCKNIEVYNPATNSFEYKDISEEVERIMREKNLL